MSSPLIVLPVWIPLVAGVAGLVFWGRPRFQHWLSHVSAVCLFVVSLLLLNLVWEQGIQTVQLGHWPAPFGISFVADLFSALMIVINGITAVIISMTLGIIRDRKRTGFGQYPLIHFLLAGVSGAFLTGDFFNLYVWFEVMLMASFVLIVLGNSKAQMEGGFKYVAINIVSSVLFLAALGILYGKTGTLNMADLSLKLTLKENSEVALISGVLFMIAFGIKAGLFPLFFWLPSSYHTPPPVISALFVALLTKVGVYALIRSFTLVFTQDLPYTHGILLIISGFTMVTGVLGAASQFHIRKILSFHTISQIGYMVMGLALFTTAALSAAIFYMLHHFMVKTNLFLISGIVKEKKGTEELKKIGGLTTSSPRLAILFLASALSLAGVPPLTGFFAKFAVIKASFDVQHYWIAGVALAVGVLTLYSMTKIWAEAFWKQQPDCQAKPVNQDAKNGLFIPVAVMAILTIAFGLFPHYLFQFTDVAAEQLLNPELYIQRVLGEEYVYRFKNP